MANEIGAFDAGQCEFHGLAGLGGRDLIIVPGKFFRFEKDDRGLQCRDALGVEQFQDQAAIEGRVVEFVQGDCRMAHALARDHGKIQRVASLARQLLQEDSESPAIAFAERMHGREIGNHIGDGAAEIGGLDPAPKIMLAQILVELLEGSRQKARVQIILAFRLFEFGLARDGAVGARDFFVARAARLFIDVLIKMLVQGLQIGRIEGRLGACARGNLDAPRCREGRFQGTQLRRVLNAERVLEDIRVRVSIVRHEEL